MKSYPSIPKIAPPNTRFLVFDKLDGSNLRFEWNPKRGWYKYGTRTHLFDESDNAFGPAIQIFHSGMAATLDRIARVNKWEGLIVFAEFWGEGSFAGKHKPEEPKHLTLFDAAPHKKGILGPEEFMALFGGVVETPKYLGELAWTPEFVEQVRAGDLPGMTFEGVVGKAGKGHQLQMVKAKTQAWIDKVRTIYTPEQAAQLIAS